MESIVCARKRFDIAVAAEDPRNLIAELKGFFQVAAHPHSINLELSGSDLRAQIGLTRATRLSWQRPNARKCWAARCLGGNGS